MSNKLSILTEKYHATEASLAALKEEILAEVLKSSPASLSTLVSPLHGVRVEQPIQKSKTGVKRGKNGKLPELYYPELSRDTPVSVPDLAKKLNVKNANATSFLRTQVKKGLLKNTKGKYTLTDKGEGFKATLSGGSAPVAKAAAAKKPTVAKAPKEKKAKRTRRPALAPTLLPIINKAGDAGISPKELAKTAVIDATGVSQWLLKNKSSKANPQGVVKSIGGGKYVITPAGKATLK